MADDENLVERDPQWLRGVLPLLVLAVLHRGETYGYDMASQFEASGLGPVKGGTLYPVLGRLQDDGLVDVRWSEPAAGPARKYYRLTSDGQRHLQSGARTWLDFTARAGLWLRAIEGVPIGTNRHDIPG